MGRGAAGLASEPETGDNPGCETESEVFSPEAGTVVTGSTESATTGFPGMEAGSETEVNTSPLPAIRLKNSSSPTSGMPKRSAFFFFSGPIFPPAKMKSVLDEMAETIFPPWRSTKAFISSRGREKVPLMTQEVPFKTEDRFSAL